MHLTIPTRDPLPAGLVAEPLPVLRVLYEAEMPIVYLTKTAQGQLLLAYVADDTADGTFTLLAPTTEELVDALENGSLSVHEAITNSWLWLHLRGGQNSGLWTCDLKEIPADFLPLPGTMLLPEHEPVLRTRAVGQQIVLGRMPASVISFVADATRKAMKTLLDYAFATPAEGRPREEHRTLYDLPIQAFALSSFELSFGAPDEGLVASRQIREAAQQLEQGLVWASDKDAPLDKTGDEREAILRATLFLTPPAVGPIVEVQISGSWISRGKVRLTRESRKRIHQELRRFDSERVVTYEGRIGELDVDNYSFTLRDIPDGQERRGVFDEDLLDDMLALLTDAGRVAVAGIETQGRLRVSAIVPVRTP